MTNYLIYFFSIVFVLVEDENQIKSECIITKDHISPNKTRARNGSSTEMAVDQLQASEKLIAGKYRIITKTIHINVF